MAVSTKICPVCGAEFGCANLGDGTVCWCAALPPVMELHNAAGCLCPVCLKKAIQIRTEQYTQDVVTGKCKNTVAGKLPMDVPPVEDIDYYMEHGNFVFKGWYLLKRGYCCHNNCRHCPYKGKTATR